MAGPATSGARRIPPGCYFSDDKGQTWKRSTLIDLPKRGAMEASVVELNDGSLMMTLRTQLGGPHIARSKDRGKTWSKAVFSGLRVGNPAPACGGCPAAIAWSCFGTTASFSPGTITSANGPR